MKCLCADFQPKIDAAWQLFLACPGARECFEGIGIEKGPKLPGKGYEAGITVKCVEQEEIERLYGKNTKNHAYWDRANMTVAIMCGTPDNLIGLILMELTNASTRDAHSEINKQCLRVGGKKPTKVEFVDAHELVEYHNMRTHHAIAKQCVADGDWTENAWPDTPDRYQHSMNETEEQYLAKQKATSVDDQGKVVPQHSIKYEEWWEANCK